MSPYEQAAGKHILVVDDDQEILEIVQEILKGEGYRVQASLNSACLQHLESDSPDLILLDILLQGENGCDLCRQLKGHEQTRHIPVILFSAHIAASSAMQACEADDFLAKPFRLQELLNIVALRLRPI